MSNKIRFSIKTTLSNLNGTKSYTFQPDIDYPINIIMDDRKGMIVANIDNKGEFSLKNTETIKISRE